MKPFSGRDVREWFLKFEVCTDANSWDSRKKVPTLLEREALAAWTELRIRRKTMMQQRQG